jgi:hypothetical protein
MRLVQTNLQACSGKSLDAVCEHLLHLFHRLAGNDDVICISQCGQPHGVHHPAKAPASPFL